MVVNPDPDGPDIQMFQKQECGAWQRVERQGTWVRRRAGAVKIRFWKAGSRDSPCGRK